MVRITLKQCEYFVAIAQQGGIAQAARELNISQPAVAQSLDKLEQLSGLRLFVRHLAKGVELTPEGRSFLESASSLVAHARQTECDAEAIAANTAGIIRFGCFHTLAPYYLSSIISRYNATQPDVKINATEMRQAEIIAAINSDELDLALTYDMSLNPENLKSEVLARLRPFILLNDQHPLAKRSTIKMSELANEPYVMFDGPSSRDYFEGLLASHGVAPVVSLRAQSMESVRSAVANGLGFSLAVITNPYAETYGGGKAVSVPIAGEVETLSIVLISKRTGFNSALLDTFIAFCHALFREHFD